MIGDTSPAVTATITSSSSAKPSACASTHHQDLAAAKVAERGHVTIAVVRGDRQGVAELGEGRGHVAREQVADRLGNQRAAALHAVAGALQGALGPSQPAAGGGHLAAEEEGEVDPQRVAGGARPVAAPEAIVVGPRPERGAVAVLADEVRGDRQLFEIVEVERRQVIGRRQLSVGVAPALLAERFPARVEG